MEAATIIKLRFNTNNGDIDIEITETEARDLYSFLDRLFGSKNTYSWPMIGDRYKEYDYNPITTPLTGDNIDITWCQSDVQNN